jgi:RNA polymerase sigma-70 factor (ECF subfamily)
MEQKAARNELPTTRPSLLIRIRDSQDSDAWAQFVELYAPLVHAFGRQRCLQDADASDVTQMVLQAVAGAMKRFEYDPKRGSFRGWLLQVTRNQLHAYQTRHRRFPVGSGDTAAHALLEQQPAPEEDDELWDREYQRRLFAWAAEKVRKGSSVAAWQAFWLTAVEDKSAKEAADELGTSVGAVYTAKSRIMDRIRQEIHNLQVSEVALPEKQI